MKEHIIAAIDTKRKILASSEILQNLTNIISLLKKVYQKGGKMLIAGNGGSAADAQHFAAEIVGHYQIKRPGRPALALTTDTSALTSISNDDGYDYIFSRQIEALGQAGDVLIVITTSDLEEKEHGHSANLWQAIEQAKKQNLTVIGLLSEKSKRIGEMVDHHLKVPSQETPIIQEVHIMLIHIICAELEKSFV
ncbi:MAG: hypothetical protein A2233_03710 [Candidatus Kerfeldbacteria bacterium RIFOXYA2_FULL_38_24]|uniref:SIS domain-containing protein n=1 Tax=Candidatus Kerfeldbacteria bacterium RIFOXYB2_FULL_38_14 TaxID=1798547 RepID=A0A1G2BCV2_9BACT|nr:MAG: hypothetical protein A2233_03710 [Candidatus Kerfeldbacteria bacterium RIFOXYA2_FULL_38_24]OGY86090.1 MAG: hypothetical protein A2319_01355 [Candidatus Kerfeldbacteria bacterium RIFOXYB2_FULL_38_14]OGY88973.1 MAG: hypothetical protein A2458_04560 [Candidatus Kerfeldbacteria bacterium RIFOXYC2_FULL_38_9]